MASRVSAMSVTTPSVRISRMKYCWGARDALGGLPGPAAGPMPGEPDKGSALTWEQPQVARACWVSAQPGAHQPGAAGTYRSLLRPLLVGRHASHLGDDGSHVGGAVELDFGQAALVGLHDTLDACGGMRGARGAAPGSGTGGAVGAASPALPGLDSPSHSSLSGLKLMAKSWETWRARGEGAAGAHPPATAPGTCRAPQEPRPRVPGATGASLGSHGVPAP